MEIASIPNPRKEAEDHYYNATHTGLTDLGLEPHLMTEDVLSDMLGTIIEHRDAIERDKIMPRVKWNK